MGSFQNVDVATFWGVWEVWNTTPSKQEGPRIFLRVNVVKLGSDKYILRLFVNIQVTKNQAKNTENVDQDSLVEVKIITEQIYVSFLY